MMRIVLARGVCLTMATALLLQAGAISNTSTTVAQGTPSVPSSSTLPPDTLPGFNENTSHIEITNNNGTSSGNSNGIVHRNTTDFYNSKAVNQSLNTTNIPIVHSTTSSYETTTTASNTSTKGICDVRFNERFPSQCMPCAITEQLGCPRGAANISKHDCVSQYGGASCLYMCEKLTVRPQCCPGWWGTDCQPCPYTLTPDNETAVCNNQGLCSDGKDGQGRCSCNSYFSGTACELCARNNVYGAFCNETCECVHGVCDAGLTGTGNCECDHGFGGKRCDKQIHCLQSLCGTNAHCREDSSNVNCTCDRGYEGDGKNCTLIDFCSEDFTWCDIEADCTMNGPANYTCVCKEGYSGDGFVCLPIDRCQDEANLACPFNTTKCVYTSPGQFSCQCLPGFNNFTENYGCDMRDLCQENKNLCHRNANCTMEAPGLAKCKCHEGYVGSGYTCFGNILHTLKELNTGRGNFRFKLNKTIEYFSLASQTLESKRGLTVFVPTDMRVSSSENQYIVIQRVKQHIIPVVKTLNQLKSIRQLYTMEGTAAQIGYNKRRKLTTFKLQGFYQKARVIRSNVLAANGIIHFINLVITKRPVIGYKPRQTLLSQIQSDGRYNRLESLLASAGLQEILNKTTSNITVFAPSNRAWDSMAAGTVQYLQSRAGRGKLIALLKNHILGTAIHSFDLLSVNRLQTLANNVIDVRISPKGQFKLNTNVSISQTDIPAAGGLYHHVNDILIPESIKPLLPRYCDTSLEERVEGLCGPCNQTLHCPLPTDTPDYTQAQVGCTFMAGTRRNQEQHGCSQPCKRRKVIRRCCPNFYGPNCNPCPGGHIVACGGRGKCNDGINGTGVCECQQNFTGTICEKCRNSELFGPQCAKECTCLHGECDNQVNSKGNCKRGTCEPLFLGQDCQLVNTPCGLSRHCHVHAVCRMDNLTSDQITHLGGPRMLWGFMRHTFMNVKCHCKDGYRGDGKECSIVNRCEDPDHGGCHREAECIFVSPGQSNCTCRSGWVGDGTYCYPSTVCSNHNHCHANAQCLATIPGEYRCECMENYHGDGVNCVANNMCEHDWGGCHALATCTSYGPGNRTCTCNQGYAGDGISCYGSLWQEIESNPQTADFQKLLSGSQLPALLSNFSTQYTVFAPQNISLIQGKGNASIEPDALYLRYHVIQGRFDTSHLQTLAQTRGSSGHYFIPTLAGSDQSNLEINITSSVNELLINSAHIVSANHYALNGMLHVIDTDLSPLEPSANLSVLFSRHASFSRFYQDLQRTGLFGEITSGNLSHYTIFSAENNIWRPNVRGELLKKYMSYYVIPHRITLNDLATKTQVSSLLGEGPSGKLNITSRSGKVFVNGNMVYDNRLRSPRGNVFKLMSMLHPNLNRCDQQHLDGAVHAQCCPGFYGFDCLDCPGGNEAPCNKHGVCDDSLSGNGICTCREGFTGQDCGTCEDGYKGPKCELDMCTLCHAHAICHTRGTNISCVCAPGYVGDGIGCDPACQKENGGCDENADCSASPQTGIISCLCAQGFHGTGWNCTKIVDLCLEDNGGCSDYANCTFNPPERMSSDNGFVECTCKAGYTGNGTLCNGDLLSTLSSMNETRDFYDAIAGAMGQETPYGSIIKELFENSGKNKTIFAPINWIELNSTETAVLDIERHIVAEYIMLNITYFEDDQSIYPTISGENITIQGPSEQGQFTVNGTHIITPNIPSINGIIHLIENKLEPKTPTETLPVRSRHSMKMTPYIIGALLFIVIMVIVIALIIAKRKSNWPRFKRHRDDDNEFNFKILNSFDPTEPTNEEMLDASAVFKNPLYDRLVDSS